MSDVNVLGAEQAAADMAGWVKTIIPTAQRESTSLGASLRSQLASRVPHLTGRLAASAAVSPAADTDGVFTLGMGEGLEYGGWIEFGGSRGRDLVQLGRYVYPTVHEAESNIADMVDRATTDSINQFHWSAPG
jgi:hypothetical protein